MGGRQDELQLSAWHGQHVGAAFQRQPANTAEAQDRTQCGSTTHCSTGFMHNNSWQPVA
jgi:hypothetical protein